MSAEMVARGMQGEAKMLESVLLRPRSDTRTSEDGSNITQTAVCGAGAVASSPDNALCGNDKTGLDADGMRVGYNGGSPSPLQHAARMAWLDMPLSQRVGWSQTSDRVSVTLLLPIGRCSTACDGDVKMYRTGYVSSIWLSVFYHRAQPAHRVLVTSWQQHWLVSLTSVLSATSQLESVMTSK
jgi:hypothetical protein